MLSPILFVAIRFSASPNQYLFNLIIKRGKIYHLLSIFFRRVKIQNIDNAMLTFIDNLDKDIISLVLYDVNRKLLCNKGNIVKQILVNSQSLV